MSNCNVTFWKHVDDGEGEEPYKNYDGPISVPDLHDVHWHDKPHNDVEDDISWIDTSSHAWVRIYSSTNYQGRTALIGPNQHVNMKDIRDDNNEDDMDDTIESFQIYDHKPNVNTTNIINNFVALYPGADRDRKDYRYENEWYAQDSQYRVYYPSIKLNADKIYFTINLDHEQAEIDDYAEVTFSMNLKGDFVDRIQVIYDMGHAAQIPDWVIKLVDGAIEEAKYEAIIMADGAEIVLTDGIGVIATVETDVLINYTAKALTFCVDHLNTVLSAVFKFQDDGGTTNFPAIVSHSIARLVLAYYQELYGPDSNDSLDFNQQNFFNKLGIQSKSWDESKHNPFVEFEHSSYPYRSYYPDIPSFTQEEGHYPLSKLMRLLTLKKMIIWFYRLFMVHKAIYFPWPGVLIFLRSRIFLIIRPRPVAF